MQPASDTEKAIVIFRERLCNFDYLFRLLSDVKDSNYSKLRNLLSTSLTEACNNTILLLGPRGNGKSNVLELVLSDLMKDFPNSITLVRLNGLFHVEDKCTLKEIAKQLCVEHELSFSKIASFDDNSQFIVSMLREAGLAHKTIIFVLDEFDLFAQGKQRMIYSLLDAMQSVTSQAVMIGISCRIDADQLLEKRVRSRFSHRKLLFLPPSDESIQQLLQHVLFIPNDSNISYDYINKFNDKIRNLLADVKFKEIITNLSSFDLSIERLKTFLFRFACCMNDSSSISFGNFNTILPIIETQPKQEALRDCSVLELYVLICLKRLETKGEGQHTFVSVVKEYRAIQESIRTCDRYSDDVCLRSFVHLIERDLITFTGRRLEFQCIEFRPVKSLVSLYEIVQALKSNTSFPVILHKLLVGGVNFNV